MEYEDPPVLCGYYQAEIEFMMYIKVIWIHFQLFTITPPKHSTDTEAINQSFVRPRRFVDTHANQKHSPSLLAY